MRMESVMPVVSENEKAEFSAKVPRELYDEFRRYFPAYGGTTWFINTALNTFMESVRHDPDAVERIQKSIELMVQENREAQ
jgi:hypothetical protein